MAGTIELFTDSDECFRFRIKAQDGTVVAVSVAFEEKAAAIAGISALREYAGMGLVTDACPAALPVEPVRAIAPAPCVIPAVQHVRGKPFHQAAPHTTVPAPGRTAWSGAA
ncbi:YegP family protein [bacterium RCC_150]